MLGPVRSRLRDSGRTVAAVFANPSLRRIELARAAVAIGVFSYTVVFAVLAYRVGGVAAVGILAVVRMLPSAVASPFTALLGDRFSRKHVMVAADVVRASVLACAAIVAASDPAPLAIYVLAGLAALAGTASSPARAALTPSLARTPDELVAANVVGTATENAAAFAGPALGGLVLALGGAPAALTVSAAASATSAFLIARIRVDREQEPRRSERPRMLSEASAGFRVIAAEPRVRLLVGLFALQTLIGGAIGILLVAAAIDLLELGEAGVGLVNSVVGVGGLLGAALMFGLVSDTRLSTVLAAGACVWGLPVTLVGAWPEPAVALLFIAAIGIGDSLVDVAGFTLLQNAIPRDVLARVFGALGSISFATIALGAALAPLLVTLIGLRGALIAAGLVFPVATAACWRALRNVDRADVPVDAEFLRRAPMLAPLAGSTLTQLAASGTLRDVEPGEVLFRRGDAGDRFYLVVAGEVEIALDGRTIEASAGDSFGEIALLRDVSRTATVTARTAAKVFAIERDDFLAAMTASSAALAAAEGVVAERLARSAAAGR